MTLYSRLDALLKARPKMMVGALAALAATAFFFNPAIPAWIAGVMLLPMAFSVVMMVVWKPGSGAKKTKD